MKESRSADPGSASTDSLFDEFAGDYDEHRRDLIPDFDGFYGTILERIPFSRDDAFELLDLGAGTGLGTRLIQSAYPDVTATLLDESAEMIDRARDRFSDETVSFRVEGFGESEFNPDAFDVAISALALHYVPDDVKKTLIGRVHRAIRTGGTFVFGTLVQPPSESVGEQYQAMWIREARDNGVRESAIDDARKRQDDHDLASIGDHLAWLNEAGFNCVDCWYKNYGLAVFSGDVGEVNSRFG